MTMEVNIRIHGDVKKFYSYRSGLLGNLTLVIEDREGSNLSMAVRNYLNSQGYRMDNHICWESTSGVCYGYSDHKFYVGSYIKEERW